MESGMYAPETKETTGRLASPNKPSEGLSKKVVKGGFWAFTLRGFSRLFGIARLIFLARVLAPADFGLMGTALLVMSTLEAFSQTGFESALVQKTEDIEEYLDTAWTVSILRGIILFVILCLIAPCAASFFDEPAAKSIIRVSGFSILFQAFANIGIIYFHKELEFNKQFTYEFSGMFAGEGDGRRIRPQGRASSIEGKSSATERRDPRGWCE